MAVQFRRVESEDRWTFIRSSHETVGVLYNTGPARDEKESRWIRMDMLRRLRQTLW